MLETLTLNHFVIADRLSIDFFSGMSAITGETGAGKSVVLDALSLTLGERADTQKIRHGYDKADIQAVFNIDNNPDVQQWLSEQMLETDDNECMLRRVISRNGNSRAFINQRPVTVNMLKILGLQLMHLHGQHSHHQLLQKTHHQVLLDAFGGLVDLCSSCKDAFGQWKAIEKKWLDWQEKQSTAEQRKDFLRFQLEEFSLLKPEPGEYESLDQQQQQLSQRSAILSTCEEVVARCQRQDNSLADQLQQCVKSISSLQTSNTNTPLHDAQQLLDQASILINEACTSLSSQQSMLDEDGNDLQAIEHRLSVMHDLARKHRVDAQTLPDLWHTMQNELSELENQTETSALLEQQCEQAKSTFIDIANQLSQARVVAAGALNQAVIEQLNALNMGTMDFKAAIDTNMTNASSHGIDDVEFLISANKGQPLQPLRKAASGGELSRISLAIQSITAKASTIPTLVFDEVDVGIGGATATSVGKLLKTLGQSAQVLSITHQGQVAALADHHYCVSKSEKDDATQMQFEYLNENKRHHEVARMVGGDRITEQTLSHARELMLDNR